jgi:hypothetical protein
MVRQSCLCSFSVSEHCGGFLGFFKVREVSFLHTLAAVVHLTVILLMVMVSSQLIPRSGDGKSELFVSGLDAERRISAANSSLSSGSSPSLTQATAQNTATNAYLNRATTFSQSMPSTPNTNMSWTIGAGANGGYNRPDTFSLSESPHSSQQGGIEHPVGELSSAPHYGDDYWHGGIYGRPSHHTGSYTSGSSYNAGSHDTRRNHNARTWTEWLGLSK